MNEIQTWFSDGQPLKPITPEKTRKETWGCGEHERIVKHRLQNKKKAKEKWLDRIHRKRLPINFVNDKREYYRTQYLRSLHWKRLKSHKLASQWFCEQCGTEKTLDVHHLNYRNLYDVQLSDLKVLCRFCHAKEHGMVKGTKKSTIPSGIDCPF